MKRFTIVYHDANEIIFHKTKHPFIIKVLERLGIHGSYLNIIKAIATNKIKFLGITLTKQLIDLYDKKFMLLKREIRGDI